MLDIVCSVWLPHPGLSGLTCCCCLFEAAVCHHKDTAFPNHHLILYIHQACLIGIGHIHLIDPYCMEYASVELVLTSVCASQVLTYCQKQTMKFHQHYGSSLESYSAFPRESGQ